VGPRIMKMWQYSIPITNFKSSGAILQAIILVSESRPRLLRKDHQDHFPTWSWPASTSGFPMININHHRARSSPTPYVGHTSIPRTMESVIPARSTIY
jgi:hypothetical protein